MSEPFNSPKHALAFLKRRATVRRVLPRAPESGRDYNWLDVQRDGLDAANLNACRYLTRNGWRLCDTMWEWTI